MAGKREKPEDIVLKLRQVEVLQGQDCVFRGDPPTDSDLMRPPVPISSAHRFRGMRPPL